MLYHKQGADLVRKGCVVTWGQDGGRAGLVGTGQVWSRGRAETGQDGVGGTWRR